MCNISNSFAYVYNAGGIPCRINHGCNVMKLQWNPGVMVSQLSYDPILVTCVDGLTEEGHPYSFIALNACKEMLEDDVLLFEIRIHNSKSSPLYRNWSGHSEQHYRANQTKYLKPHCRF